MLTFSFTVRLYLSREMVLINDGRLSNSVDMDELAVNTRLIEETILYCSPRVMNIYGYIFIIMDILTNVNAADLMKSALGNV